MTVHVVGAGLAGLAAAERLAAAGMPVEVHEAAPQAGGRCRSYHDRTLGRVIDNGNHLMLSGNRDLHAYLEVIGATDSLTGPDEARFPFLDLATGERWTVRLGDGFFPDPTRGVPGARLRDRLAGLGLLFAGRNQTVAGCLRRTGVLWERFWAPMATAILNTPPDRASARLLRATLRESFAGGARTCRPLIARDSLAASLIDPALDYLKGRGVSPAFGQRLRALDIGTRLERLRFASDDLAIEAEDQVILALPSWQIADLLPMMEIPSGAHAIVNAHYRLAQPAKLPNDSAILGLIGGVAEWLFFRGDMVSVTVSAADDFAEEPADRIAARLWQDVASALDLAVEPMSPCRIIKEKRATFSQTPAEIEKRPPSTTRWQNLYFAGDWTDTGLPATIEGAVRSGHGAADRVLDALRGRRA